MTNQYDRAENSERHDITVNGGLGSTTGPMWFVLGLLVFAVAALGILVFGYSAPEESRLAADVRIERPPEAAQPPQGRAAPESTIPVPDESTGAGETSQPGQ